MRNKKKPPVVSDEAGTTVLDIENLSLGNLIANQDFTLEIIDTPEILLANLSEFSGQPVKGIIEKCQILRIHGKTEIQKKIYALDDTVLIGFAEGAPYITSPVSGIDPGRNLVKTQNSIYALIGEPGVGEPPLPLLLHISYALNSWGMGPLLGTRLNVFY